MKIKKMFNNVVIKKERDMLRSRGMIVCLFVCALFISNVVVAKNVRIENPRWVTTWEPEFSLNCTKVKLGDTFITTLTNLLVKRCNCTSADAYVITPEFTKIKLPVTIDLSRPPVQISIPFTIEDAPTGYYFFFITAQGADVPFTFFPVRLVNPNKYICDVDNDGTVTDNDVKKVHAMIGSYGKQAKANASNDLVTLLRADVTGDRKANMEDVRAINHKIFQSRHKTPHKCIE